MGLVGAGNLFGLGDRVKVSALVDRIEDLIAGRLLVFFPGEVEQNNYRLLNGTRRLELPRHPHHRRQGDDPVTLTNRDVFAIDPTERRHPEPRRGEGQEPRGRRDWATLEWELRSFVCEGEYERGLERILDQFLSHLGQAEQPAVWVSGFYGSGKSHLMRVLEYLWRDYELPSGVSARSLTTLPSEIEAHLKELSTAGKRAGGLWSAAGTLGSGASGSVRLAFLGVMFDAAGLPQQYGPARLALWMNQENLYDQVRDADRGQG